MALRDTDSVKVQVLERENQRLRRSVQELSMLNDLAREIGASRESNEVMQKIIRKALKSVQAEQGVITLVEDREGDPMTTLVRTAGSSVKRDPFHLNDSLLGWMQQYKIPLVLNNPADDTRFKGARWDASIRSMLCVPLLVRSRLTGLLTVYNKRSGNGFTDDDERLLAIIAAQSAQIVENARLYEEEKTLVTMREELRLAYEIQMTLLPKAPPEIPGYELAGKSIPAQTVGGDYFDFIPTHDNNLALCVADVSGKGLPASLLMANVQATLRGQTPWSSSVQACLERSNKLLCESIRRGTFVTLFYGILNPQEHQFLYANAGHNRPLLLRNGKEPTELSSGGLVLGVLPSYSYTETSVDLHPSDVLLLYSDGITEAMNSAREQFGEDRLAALLETHGHLSAQALIDQIVLAVQQHSGNAPQTDDMTLLAVRRLP